ncbi:MAG: methyltransferase domain-containing protein [Bdellovibrionota bacterium]
MNPSEMRRGQESFRICIDSPTRANPVSSPIFYINGWIAGETIERPILRSTDGKYVRELHCVPRPDVVPHVEYPCVVGFSGLLSILQLQQHDGWELRFQSSGGEASHEIQLSCPAGLLEDFWAVKRNKLANLINLLKCPTCSSYPLERGEDSVHCPKCKRRYAIDDLWYHFVPSEPGTDGMENCGSCYDGAALEILNDQRNAHVLDSGCGSRLGYHWNSYNLDISPAPTVDVIGSCSELPFRDQVFDAVLSNSVLEHIDDPFLAAREMVRVVKPGGLIYVTAPLLAPFHGVPNHFFNMTQEGLSKLFSGTCSVEERGVFRFGRPIWALTWFLRSYSAGLPKDTAEDFGNMRIKDFLGIAEEHVEKPYVSRLSEAAEAELACANYILVRKR